MYIQPGIAYLAKTGPDERHLRIIVYGQTHKTEDVIFVDICSHYKGCDETTLIQPGDHPFIVRLSYAEYELLAIQF